MGSCCGIQSQSESTHVKQYENEKPKLPKIIVTSQDTAVIYLNVSMTNQSNRLRRSLKRQFPTLIEVNREKQIFKRIQSMKERKCYIVIAGFIHDSILRSLIFNSKVKGLYFCLEQIDFHQYSRSNKIKGFFHSQNDLKRTIFYDIRFDENY